MTTPTLTRTATRRTYPTSGVMLRSNWWLLLFVGCPVAALAWLGWLTYTVTTTVA